MMEGADSEPHLSRAAADEVRGSLNLVASLSHRGSKAQETYWLTERGKTLRKSEEREHDATR
ncbi:MAG: hypothetical protein WAL73_02270, partial [Terracidiphilus sp.]